MGYRKITAYATTDTDHPQPVPGVMNTDYSPYRSGSRWSFNAYVFGDRAGREGGVRLFARLPQYDRVAFGFSKDSALILPGCFCRTRNFEVTVFEFLCEPKPSFGRGSQGQTRPSSSNHGTGPSRLCVSTTSNSSGRLYLAFGGVTRSQE